LVELYYALVPGVKGRNDPHFVIVRIRI